MKLLSLVLGLAAAMTAGSPAYAAGSANGADLTVRITPPSGVYVGAPGQYQVAVANTGNRQADDVRVNISLPATHTSPQVSVLGTLGAFDSRCTRTGTNLNCSLGSIRKDDSKSVLFTISLPQSSAPLVDGEPAASLPADHRGTGRPQSALHRDRPDLLLRVYALPIVHLLA
ncbi:MAG: hypothetical protein NTZ05_03095 [Chloroflexi bacterium]|nr:hypothetical protein [Chloroflexota bacterium]